MDQNINPCKCGWMWILPEPCVINKCYISRVLCFCFVIVPSWFTTMDYCKYFEDFYALLFLFLF